MRKMVGMIAGLGMVLGGGTGCAAEQPQLIDAPLITSPYYQTPDGSSTPDTNRFKHARDAASMAFMQSILDSAAEKPDKAAKGAFLVTVYCNNAQKFHDESALAIDRALLNREVRNDGLEAAYTELHDKHQVPTIEDFQEAALKECPDIIQLTHRPMGSEG